MVKYKSKIGLELVIPIMLVLSTTLILMAYQQVWPGIIIIILATAFISHMFLTTYYLIRDNQLFINCGFFFKKTVSIDTIKKISETNNFISSPAASLDRLEIRFNKYDSVIISPKEKSEFIKDLLSIKPAIEVHLKTKK